MSKVTILISDELWKKFRMWCLENDTTAGSAMEKLIEAKLKEKKK